MNKENINKFKDIVIVGKYKNTDMGSLVNKIILFLEGKGSNIYLAADTVELTGIDKPVADKENGKYDLIIAIGGDGTMMGACRDWFEKDIPLIGINSGRVGFLTDLDQDNMFDKFNEILRGDCKIEEREVLKVEEYNGQKLLATDYCINDLVGRSANGKLIEYMLFVNEQEFVNNQYADGLIISTPTGSTAYSLAAGGPIIHPSSKVLAVVPICPQKISNKPFIISSDNVIKVSFNGKGTITWSVDGIEPKVIEEGSVFHISKSPKTVKMIHTFDYSYFSGLRKKLEWC